MVGRDRELAHVIRLAEGSRLLTLTGTGGIGCLPEASTGASAIAHDVRIKSATSVTMMAAPKLVAERAMRERATVPPT